MLSDDVFRSRLMETVESLRYFLPAVAHVARCDISSSPGFWKISMTPHTPGACAVELMLHDTQRYDVTLGAETYENREINSLNLFIPLLEAIAEGRVVERTWISQATGTAVGRESIVRLRRDAIWQDGSGLSPINGHAGNFFSQDHHFLPYRR